MSAWVFFWAPVPASFMINSSIFASSDPHFACIPQFFQAWAPGLGLICLPHTILVSSTFYHLSHVSQSPPTIQMGTKGQSLDRGRNLLEIYMASVGVPFVGQD